MKPITFRHGNNIRFFQDFGISRGLPPGIEFTAEPWRDTEIRLSAPGYGDRSAGGKYGNGKISISRDDYFRALEEQETMNDEEMESTPEQQQMNDTLDQSWRLVEMLRDLKRSQPHLGREYAIAMTDAEKLHAWISYVVTLGDSVNDG